jgi:hypothetical protein
VFRFVVPSGIVCLLAQACLPSLFRPRLKPCYKGFQLDRLNSVSFITPLFLTYKYSIIDRPFEEFLTSTSSSTEGLLDIDINDETVGSKVGDINYR